MGGYAMAFHVWVLLLFAGWTLAVLTASVGVYRWSHILTGRKQVRDFRADRIEGADWYRRAMRAHANCVENLPIYGAIVVAALAAQAGSPRLDELAAVILAARIAQSLIHIAFTETNAAVAARFTFYTVQLVCFFWMGILVAGAA